MRSFVIQYDKNDIIHTILAMNNPPTERQRTSQQPSLESPLKSPNEDSTDIMNSSTSIQNSSHNQSGSPQDPNKKQRRQRTHFTSQQLQVSNPKKKRVDKFIVFARKPRIKAKALDRKSLYQFLKRVSHESARIYKNILGLRFERKSLYREKKLFLK